MCCVFSILVFLGPRFGLIFWYLYQPERFDRIFDGWVMPVLGWVFVPWTTLMWVSVGINGVNGIDWLWVGLGLLADIATYCRRRMAQQGPDQRVLHQVRTRAKTGPESNSQRPWRSCHGRW